MTTMGYYTKHRITLSAPLPVDWNPDDGGDGSDPIRAGQTTGSMHGKWYDRTPDMVEMSNAHPEILFTIEGQGDETGDLWIEYWQNGRVQHERPSFAPFDPAKLKTPD